MKYYFAALLSRQAEMRCCRREIELLDHSVTSSWVNVNLSSFGESADATRAAIAGESLDEIRSADVIILFAEPRGSANIGGGRHFEAGLGLGLGKKVVVIGHREHVYCCVPGVDFYNSWDEFLESIR